MTHQLAIDLLVFGGLLLLAVVLYGLLIQGFALVPLARRLQITLPDPGADPPLDTAPSS